MTFESARRLGNTCISSFAVIFLVSQMGCQGPAGPPGPPGASAGGPPYVWVCSPASYPATPSYPSGKLYVFNGSSTTANVAVNFLNEEGANLFGQTIPGTVPETYPGQGPNSTAPLVPGKTMVVTWRVPQTAVVESERPRVLMTIRVTSDQPVAVSTNIQSIDAGPAKIQNPVPCILLPK